MVKVLFLCLGNICRSPMAASIFRHLVHEKNLGSQFKIDSAGILSFHSGAPADERTCRVLSDNEIDSSHIARQIQSEDFLSFDYILAMDKANMKALGKILPANATTHISLIRHWDNTGQGGDVPDPYLGDMEDFEEVFDMLRRSCESLLQDLIEKHGLRG